MAAPAHPLVKPLLQAWHANATRWEAVREDAEAAGLKVFNPGLYAFHLYEWFLRRFPPDPHPLLVLGLNPGPAGMAQTGVPFTDARTRRDRLGDDGFDLPGVAPDDLVPLLKKPNGRWRLTYERSSLVIYRFLDHAFLGDLREAYRNWYVGNPCPLLFLEADGGNVTPADRRLKKLVVVDELRHAAIREVADIVKPRGIIALGRDLQNACGDGCLDLVGGDAERYVPFPHPARQSPDGWARELTEELMERGLLDAATPDTAAARAETP